MVHLYSNDYWELDEFDTRCRQQAKPRLQACTRSTRPRQSAFKRQDWSSFQPESYTTYYMDKEEDEDIYGQPLNYPGSPENIPDDLMLGNDYNMNSWNRRPRRRRSLAIPNLERNDHYAHHQHDINRGNIPKRRQRRSSYVSPPSPPIPQDSNRYYMESDYNYDQDDVYYARSDLSRRDSLQHLRHEPSHWVKPKVMGPMLPQHRLDPIHTPSSSSFYNGQVSLQPPILSMPPPMITLPSFVPPPLGISPFPGVLPPFHPMMMMPQPTNFFSDTKTMPAPSTAPSSPPSDKKSPSSAPVDLDAKPTSDTNGLVPLTRSLSLGTAQPIRRSLFGSLFNSESKSSDSSPSLIPVQDLSTRSLSRKQSLSLEKKAKALSQRSYIWCYRIKPSVLVMQPSNCWFAMTPRNQIKLDPYLCFFQPNTVARPDNLPTLVTLDKEPKLSGSVTAMPQAKIARVYPSIFSSSNYIELVLDCLPADSQFVVTSD